MVPRTMSNSTSMEGNEKRRHGERLKTRSRHEPQKEQSEPSTNRASKEPLGHHVVSETPTVYGSEFPASQRATSPEMHLDRTPLTRKEGAQEKFKVAAVKPEASMSKAITELHISGATELEKFENMDDMVEMTKALESVLDKIENARAAQEADRIRFKLAKDTAQEWLMASFSSIQTGLNAVALPHSILFRLITFRELFLAPTE